jgi:hypothetical protein
VSKKKIFIEHKILGVVEGQWPYASTSTLSLEEMQLNIMQLDPIIIWKLVHLLTLINMPTPFNKINLKP